MKLNLNSSSKIALCALLIIYLIIAFFCYYSPWYADDYGYGHAVELSMFKLLNAEYHHYMT